MLRKLALFSLVTAIFTCVFDAFLRVQPAGDIQTHISYADQIRSSFDLTSPHFLFQLLLKAGRALGSSYAAAAVWVLGLCYGSMALLIVAEIERRKGELTALRCFVLVPALLLAAHIFLPTVLRPNLYYGYFVPIAYHNPTQSLNKLFALWILFRYFADVLERDSASVPRAAAIGGLTIPSALAKPSFLIAFLPAAGLVAVHDGWQRRWRQVLQFVIIAVPATVVLLWQARVAYGAGESAGVVFAPFAVFQLEPTLYKLPLSMAFPLVVWAFAWRCGSDDTRLRFVALFTAIGLFITLFLAEEGRLGAGNFAWTGQTAVFLAYVECFLFLVTRPATGWQSRAAWTVFSVHVACGIIWYAAVFFPERANYL